MGRDRLRRIERSINQAGDAGPDEKDMEQVQWLLDQLVRMIQYAAPEARARYGESPNLEGWSTRDLLALAGSFIDEPIPEVILSALEQARAQVFPDPVVQKSMTKFDQMALVQARDA